MSVGASLVCPIQPHEIPPAVRDRLDDIVRRVVTVEALSGRGHDLMLRVYLAGMHHGVLLGAHLDALDACTTGGSRPIPHPDRPGTPAGMGRTPSRDPAGGGVS